MEPDQLRIFEECRPILASVATRILGNPAEVEDMLQEACLRWERTDAAQVRSPRAFLTATVTRLCLNQIKLARVRTRADIDDVSAEELRSPEPAPDELAELADALAEAFNRLLLNLSATERVVFLLREAFDFEYSDIAAIVGRTEQNCRQILKRARDRVRSGQPNAPGPQQQHIAAVFRDAVVTGEMDELLGLLAEGAEFVRDAGDLASPAPPPVTGGALFEALLHLSRNMIDPGSSAILGNVLGRDMMIVRNRSGTAGAFVLETEGSTLKRIRLVKCPAILRYLTALTRFQTSEGESPEHTQDQTRN